MSVSSAITPISESVRERAASWHVRLTSEEAKEADWLEFEAWLAEDAVHRRAYEAVEQVWSDLSDAPASAADNLARLRPRPDRRWVVWGGALAASIAAVAVLAPALLPQAPAVQVFDTAPGQPQVVALADGTRITLNGGSHLTATLAKRERRVVMADGEAVFDVAKDAQRPFYIEAGEREIRVVGTEFNVLHHQGNVSVAVRRGVVEVRPAGAPEAPPIARLARGQVLIHHKGAHADAVGIVDPDAALAWTTGRLVFEAQPLADVAATLARYGTTPIVVAPEARDLPVTATLQIESEEAMLRTLPQFLPVRVEREADKLRLNLRR